MEPLEEWLPEYLRRGTVLLLLTTVVLGIHLYLQSRKARRKLPPGPPIWPIFGSLPHMSADLQIYTDFAEKYGDIYHLELGLFGSRPTVVINDIDLVREILLKKKDEFANRSRTPVFDYYSYNGAGLVFGDLSKPWRYTRKIAHHALRKYTTGNEFQELLTNNVNAISNVFRKAKGKPVDVFKPSSAIVYNIMGNLCFGKKYDEDDPDFQVIQNNMDMLCELFAGFFLSDLHPLLKYIPTAAYKFCQIAVKHYQNLVATIIREHRSNFDKNDVNDFVDYIIDVDKEIKEAGLEEYKVELTNMQKQIIIMDMFLAGTDSSRNIITWIMLYLAAHPDIQAKAYKEIDQQFGRDGQITMFNRDKIPYCEAILFEVLRHRPPAPMGIPHAAACDSTIGGYDIAKGTQILINFWRIHNNPNDWEDSHIFKPERFMDKQGNLAPKPNTYMPFSAGRRQCVGEAMVKVEMHVIMGMLLQRFSFHPPQEGGEVDLSPKKNLFLFSAEHTHLRILER